MFIGQILNVEITLRIFYKAPDSRSVLTRAYQTPHDLISTCFSDLILSIPYLTLSALGFSFSIKP